MKAECFSLSHKNITFTEYIQVIQKLRETLISIPPTSVSNNANLLAI